MRRLTHSLHTLAVKHATPKTIRVALALLTLTTLIIAGGAPGSSGGPNIGP